MKKNIKKFISFTFSLAMMVSVLYAFHPCTVKAAESSNPVYTLNVKYSCIYTSDVIKNLGTVAVAPDFSVDFDLKAGPAGTPKKDGQLPLKAGIMDGIDKTQYTVSFKSSDYNEDELNALRAKNSKKWSDVSGHVSTSDNTQIKKVSVDFSNVKYPNPGVYHYILSVKMPESKSVVEAPQDKKHGDVHIFVYVTQNDDGSLSTNAFAGDVDGDLPYKDNRYNSTQKTGSISFYYGGNGFSIDKGVTGNMGDKSEYFLFNVHMENLDKNKIYKIGTEKATGPSDNPNDEYFISDDEGKADAKIKLKNGDETIFPYLPEGATYKITEEKQGGYDTLLSDLNDGYSPAVKAINTPYRSDESNKYYGYYYASWLNKKEIDLSNGKHISGSYNYNNEMTGLIGNIYYSGVEAPLRGYNMGYNHYINVRNGVLPTGIVLNNLPAIFGILSVALMAVIIFLTRKKPSKKQ